MAGVIDSLERWLQDPKIKTDFGNSFAPFRFHNGVTRIEDRILSSWSYWYPDQVGVLEKVDPPEELIVDADIIGNLDRLLDISHRLNKYEEDRYFSRIAPLSLRELNLQHLMWKRAQYKLPPGWEFLRLEDFPTLRILRTEIEERVREDAIRRESRGSEILKAHPRIPYRIYQPGHFALFEKFRADHIDERKAYELVAQESGDIDPEMFDSFIVSWRKFCKKSRKRKR